MRFLTSQPVGLVRGQHRCPQGNGAAWFLFKRGNAGSAIFTILALCLLLTPCHGQPSWLPLRHHEVASACQPTALGIDESGRIFWLETRGQPGGALVGRIHYSTADGDLVKAITHDVPHEPGRCALLAWRNRCFLATPPTIRILDFDENGAVIRSKIIDHRFPSLRNPATGGFGGLTMGPDGRIYGSFGDHATEDSARSNSHTGAVFRFEVDGSGFELVHRGLLQPGVPVFDGSGQAWLIDASDDEKPGARWMKMLDGGYGSSSALRASGFRTLPEASAYPDSMHVFCLARGKDDRSVLLESPDAASNFSLSESPSPTALIVDMVSDWNGVPHLLLFQPPSEDGLASIEVFRLGDTGNSTQSDQSVARINSHFDDPLLEDGSFLIDSLAHPERRIRWQAAWALSRKRNPVAALQGALDRDDPASRHAALSGMGILARRGAGAIIPGDDFEFSSVPEIGVIRRAAGSIANLLSHSSAATRVLALRTLGASTNSAKLIPFHKMMTDPAPTVRDEALLVAGRLRWRAMLDLLPPLPARSATPLDTRRLADTLDEIYTPKQLLIYSRHDDRQLRLATVIALQRHAHENLAYFVFDSDPEVAGAAVIAIDRWRMKKQFSVVARRLDQGNTDDWSLEARQAAARCR